MTDTGTGNAGQKEFWSSRAGESWVNHQAAMDAMLAPVLDMVLATADPRPGDRVLDLGCGTGASLVAVAGQVGPEGHVLGADISAPLLTMAAERTRDLPQVTVQEADAAEDALGGPHDLAISRFGVMFFADTTAAFRNIARHLAPGARLVMAAWGPAPQNPYFMEPAAVAKRILGQPPKVDRTLPGPFAWEDADRVAAMLAAAGLDAVQIEPRQTDLSPAGDRHDVARLCTRIGSAHSALRHFEATEEQRQVVEDALAEAFARFETPQGIRIPACINLVTARVPA